MADHDLSKYCVKKGEHYVAKDCKHKKNLRLFLAKHLAIVLDQVVLCTNRVEREKKKIQFGMIFEILEGSWPLV